MFRKSIQFCFFGVTMKMFYVFNLLFLFWVTTVLGENCDKYGVLIYEDLGCVPKDPQPGKCPEKFTCSNLFEKNKCNFRGMSYDDYEPVPSKISIRSCQKGCFCDPVLKSLYGSKFQCQKITCPETNRLAPTPGCHLKYNLEECCPVGRLCEPFDEIATCEVDGKTFKEGELFWPEGTCLTCVCQKNFTGKLEAPFCRRQDCGTQLTSKNDYLTQYGCAPLYFSNSTLCCPDKWACPDGTEKIEGTPSEPEVTTSKTNNTAGNGSEEYEEIIPENHENDCFWDGAYMKIGQYVVKNNVGTFPYNTILKKIRCDCVRPPLLTCRLVFD